MASPLAGAVASRVDSPKLTGHGRVDPYAPPASVVTTPVERCSSTQAVAMVRETASQLFVVGSVAYSWGQSMGDRTVSMIFVTRTRARRIPMR